MSPLLSILPIELITAILENLDYISILRCRLVCHILLAMLWSLLRGKSRRFAKKSVNSSIPARRCSISSSCAAHMRMGVNG